MLQLQCGQRDKMCVPPPAAGSLELPQVDANATRAVEASSYDGKGVKHPSTEDTPMCPPTTTSPPKVETDPDRSGVSLSTRSWKTKVGLVAGALFFAAVGVAVERWSATRSGYYSISEPVP